MSKRHQKKNFVGLYKRKLLFFSLFFVLAFSAFSMFRNSFSADEQTSDGSLYSGNAVTKNLELKKNGSILVDGKSSKYKADLLADFDEVRILVIEKPTNYVDNLQVVLTLPGDFSAETTPEVLAQHGVGGSNFTVTAPNQISYNAFGIATTGEVTIVAKMPKGKLKPPLDRQIISFLGQLKDSFWLLTAIIIPTITTIFMIMVLLYQYRRQKIDIPTKEIDSPPMSLPPAVVGALFKQQVGSREIAATLIDLARRGDLFIVDKERGFSFGKGKYDHRLLGFEKILLSKIFTKSIKSSQKEIEERINNHLYSKKMSVLTIGIYLLATRLGYFKANPYKMHFKYRLIGIFLFLLSFAGFILSLYIFKEPPYAIFFWVGAMLSSLIISAAASNMPIRTPIGQEVLSNWLAFKKFLSNPEPMPYEENNPDHFERFLPYAVVMECEAAWARRFSNHSFSLPDWFITEKNGLGLEDFCLSLYPIVSYVGKSFASIREPGFE